MFEAAVTKFTKSVGEGTLRPVPSLDASDLCKPFNVVVKKNRRWFWQTAKYEPTPFKLHQLLTDESPLESDVKTVTEEFITYNKVSKFSVKGSIGAKLKDLFDAELDGSDSILVEAKLGKVNKVAVDVPSLMGVVDKRSIKLNHDFIEQVRENKRKVLCVIVSSVVTTADTTIHSHVDWELKEKFAADKGPIHGETSGSVNDDKDKIFTVPSDTTLAYQVYELKVSGTGKMELMVEKETKGGFDAEDEVDAPLSEDFELQEVLKGINSLSQDAKNQYVTAVLRIMDTPKLIDPLLVLVKQAYHSADTGTAKETTLADLEKTFGKDKDVIDVLKTIGFDFQPDGRVQFPTKQIDLLKSSRVLLEALIELDDDELMALKDCDSNVAKPIIALLQHGIQGKSVDLDDLGVLYTEPNPGQDLINALGFQIQDAKSLVPPEGRIGALEGAYVALSALWA